MSYIANRKWSDQYIPAVKEIIGPRLLVDAPFEIDTEEATDLTTLKARDLKIAVRVRDHSALKWSSEFTIRRKVPSGARTEIHKILDGFGDWMFYGFAAHTGTSIAKWALIDLEVFRSTMARAGFGGRKPVWTKHDNEDGSGLLAFKISTFPPSLVIDSNHILLQAKAAA